MARAVTQGKSVRAAVDSERSNFEAHKRVSRQTIKAAKENDALIEIYGPHLGWNHGPVTPASRLHHVAADGKNYNPLNPPMETEGLPGTLLNCGCRPGPPFPNARMLR